MRNRHLHLRPRSAGRKLEASLGIFLAWPTLPLYICRRAQQASQNITNIRASQNLICRGLSKWKSSRPWSCAVQWIRLPGQTGIKNDTLEEREIGFRFCACLAKTSSPPAILIYPDPAPHTRSRDSSSSKASLRCSKCQRTSICQPLPKRLQFNSIFVTCNWQHRYMESARFSRHCATPHS